MTDAVIARADDLLTAFALEVLNPVALKNRVSAYHVALLAPGVCHDHGPDARLLAADCAYCRRRGNVFCRPAAPAPT